jgi:hypothetical protein
VIITAALTEAIDRIVAQRLASAVSAGLTMGTVSGLVTTDAGLIVDNQLRVVFDPSAQQVTVKTAANVQARVGDRVGLAHLGEWCVVATFGPGQLSSAGYAARGPGSSNTTSSTTYVDMPGSPTFTWVKERSLTTALLDVRAAAFSSANSGRLDLGLRLTGSGTAAASDSDYSVCHMQFSVLNNYHHLTGFRRIDNLPAGLYTVVGRWKRDSTGVAATFTIDTECEVSLMVTEVAPQPPNPDA